MINVCDLLVLSYLKNKHAKVVNHIETQSHFFSTIDVLNKAKTTSSS